MNWSTIGSSSLLTLVWTLSPHVYPTLCFPRTSWVQSVLGEHYAGCTARPPSHHRRASTSEIKISTLPLREFFLKVSNFTLVGFHFSVLTFVIDSVSWSVGPHFGGGVLVSASFRDFRDVFIWSLSSIRWVSFGLKLTRTRYVSWLVKDIYWNVFLHRNRSCFLAFVFIDAIAFASNERYKRCFFTFVLSLLISSYSGIYRIPWHIVW